MISTTTLIQSMHHTLAWFRCYWRDFKGLYYWYSFQYLYWHV